MKILKYGFQNVMRSVLDPEALLFSLFSELGVFLLILTVNGGECPVSQVPVIVSLIVQLDLEYVLKHL